MKRLTIAGICLALFCSGCSIRRVVYNETITTQQVDFVKTGRTTMSEVVAQLGAPDEMAEADSGVVALYNWSDTKSAAMDFGAIFRFFTPWSPSMTLNRTGIEPAQFLVVYDPTWTVRAYGFSRWPKEEPVVWFWPF
ncbi:hypothetical protein [Petrachloros mirabilis]